MWFNSKLDSNYPDVQTMTQIAWRSTRYVGCASGFVKNDENKYCYAAVCRYLRPGNCNISGDNWLEKTLDDRSNCGDACPEEGCH